VPAAEAATFRELGGTVAERLGVDASRFAQAATAARYGPPGAARQAAGSAREELRDLKRRLRKSLSRSDRARGLLSVRSLGLARNGRRRDGGGEGDAIPPDPERWPAGARSTGGGTAHPSRARGGRPSSRLPVTGTPRNRSRTRGRRFGIRARAQLRAAAGRSRFGGRSLAGADAGATPLVLVTAADTVYRRGDVGSRGRVPQVRRSGAVAVRTDPLPGRAARPSAARRANRSPAR
jgi:hypothetical protein